MTCSNDLHICAGTKNSDTQEFKSKVMELGNAATAGSNEGEIFGRFLQAAKASGFYKGTAGMMNK